MKNENKTNRWTVAVIVIVVLLLFSLIASMIIGAFVSTSSFAGSGNVALISISGPIVAQKTSGIFGKGYVSSDDIVELIQAADDNDEVQAIIFEINSPGGSAVGSYEIADAIRRVNKTTVAYIREVGASGGYWAASAADYIFSNKMSAVGSIGVIGSYLEFAGLLDDYNITYRRLVSGEHKDMGIPFKELTTEEERLIQERLDAIKAVFVEAVAENRGMSVSEVDQIATGLFFLGAEGKELGLIDDFGGYDEAVNYIEERLEIEAEVAEYKKTRGFADIFADLFSEQSFFVGKGIGSELVSKGKGIKIEV